jgi:phosphoglycolate phosphatase-like HAD superfamily hydrolase
VAETVFLDLDGVVLDVSRRYYRLHADLLAGIGGRLVEKETFWRLKRSRAPVEKIADLSEKDAGEYRRRWLRLVESPAYLALDGYLPGAAETLSRLASSFTVVVVSLRREPEALGAQLEALAFPAVAEVRSGPPGDDPPAAKARLIRDSPHFTGRGAIVGDTEVDIRAGKSLRLATVAVLSGLRSPELLAAESPDLILESIGDLPSALEAIYT